MDEHASDLSRVADDLGLTRGQVENVTALLDDGNTVPFITRYRKEQTGNLNEEAIRQIRQQVSLLRQLAERKRTVLRLIEAQGKLTSALRAEIEGCRSLRRLDDLYLPYRPKRKSRAEQARQRGLGPLADRIWAADPALRDLQQEAAAFVDAANDLPGTDQVLQGVADILAERISEDADVREQMRTIAWRTGRLSVSATKVAKSSADDYQNYFGYTEAVSRIPPHRTMAINRGEKSGALRVKFQWDDQQSLAVFAKHFRFNTHAYSELLDACANDALQRLVQPSLDREIRRELTERAETHAVSVFARNLRNLLLQPPLHGRRVLAIDPGFRTGCKIAVLDEMGQCLCNDVVYVTGSAEKKAASVKRLAELAREHNCVLFAIGNGTACRETEEIVAEAIQLCLPEARYLIVNEAGASIYSTSTVAQEEFPDADATQRGTISIGRRLLDPLSELVKIEPQHLGVGLYQHDVNPKSLQESLDQVIESCVNYVGVDLNTASASLLRYVSGLNRLIARRVVDWRSQHGRFQRRSQLREVPGIGESKFTQAAGFLKITDGDEPLDQTWIHPESYPVARRILDRLSLSAASATAGATPAVGLKDRFAALDAESLANELQVGVPTLNDIFDALMRPGRDPRADLPAPVFKQGILKLADLQEGMELIGTVLNVVDFGAFVDVGLKESGLVHISELSSNYVKNTHDVVSVGDIVKVWVLGIDIDRKRVSLTMVAPGTPRQQAAAKTSKPPRTKRPVEAPRPTQTTGAPTDQSAVRTKKVQSGQSAASTPLTQEMLDGSEPLSGFDQLKQLWRSRDQ